MKVTVPPPYIMLGEMYVQCVKTRIRITLDTCSWEEMVDKHLPTAVNSLNADKLTALGFHRAKPALHVH